MWFRCIFPHVSVLCRCLAGHHLTHAFVYSNTALVTSQHFIISKFQHHETRSFPVLMSFLVLIAITRFPQQASTISVTQQVLFHALDEQENLLTQEFFRQMVSRCSNRVSITDLNIYIAGNSVMHLCFFKIHGGICKKTPHLSSSSLTETKRTINSLRSWDDAVHF